MPSKRHVYRQKPGGDLRCAVCDGVWWAAHPEAAWSPFFDSEGKEVVPNVQT